MKHKLAIVIPAYKIDFFRDTLNSLVKQTCKNFTVYIGDDCSPADFETLIGEYRNRIDIVYKKFSTNLGGTDLVGQWTRCIKMTQGEPWIWLFSDDDVIGERCVEFFYKEIEKKIKYDVYHFNVQIINDLGKVVYVPDLYPSVIDVETLYRESSKDNIRSFVVENIFSREIYDKVYGFEPFPLAWGSDMATWMKMGKEKGLKTISGDTIYWRRSDKNITPNKEQSQIKRKFQIQTDYYAWVNNFFNSKRMRRFNHYVFFRYCVHYSNILEIKDIEEICNYAIKNNVIGSIQKESTIPLIPILKMAQHIKSKIIKK